MAADSQTRKRYKTGMVFGIYDTIEDRHAKILIQAAMLCDSVLVAVSSDEEIFALTRKKASMPLAERAKRVADFCNREGIPARVLAVSGKYPADIVKNNIVDAYILSSSQYERFGPILERVKREKGLLGKVTIV
jgi:phosphopantetheine adenylyltransferase